MGVLERVFFFFLEFHAFKNNVYNLKNRVFVIYIYFFWDRGGVVWVDENMK